jgi:hypothetical protein
MTDDLSELLRTLTVAQLKSVAEKHGIDITSCRGKKNYVSTIAEAGLSMEQVQDAVGAAASGKEKAAREMDEIGKDLKGIAEKASGSKDVPEGENMNIERSIDQALLLRPLFFEVDSATEHAWNQMILGDFAEALTLNRNSRSQVIERLSTFHLYSTALSIRASETLLRQMTGLETRVTAEIKTALAEAKMAFMNGPPKRRETTLEELEDLTMKALEAVLGKSVEAEKELREMLQDYASFGAHVKGSQELLEIAVQAKSSSDIEQYTKLIEQARAQASRAKDVRMKEMDGTFEQVKTAIDVAKEAGADTSEGEAQFKDAKKAFKNSEFVRAMELLASVEQAVDTAHLARVRQDTEVEAKEIAQITSSLQEAEPDLEEAAMYGMDVREGLLFVRNTKTALQHRDVVSAAKFSRKVRKLTKSMEKDLEKLREQHASGDESEGGAERSPPEQKKAQKPAETSAREGHESNPGGPSPAQPKKEKKWRGFLKK